MSCKRCPTTITTTLPPTTTTKTSPTTVSPCKDSDSNLCAQYLAAGYCSSYSSVQSYCPVSCKRCPTTITTTLPPTTTTKTSPTTVSPCKDSDSNVCAQYLVAGYCSSYSSVQSYCPVSCKRCPTTITTTLPPTTTTTTPPTAVSPCKDSDSNLCAQYLAAGYCSSYSSVQSYCPVSCKTCPKVTTTPLTTTTTMITTTTTLTQTPTTTITVGQCKDSDSNSCSQYLAGGYCSLYASVRNFCPLSCRVCTTTTTILATTSTSCKDINSIVCAQYVNLGYCTSYKFYMQTNCPVSCNFCQCKDTDAYASLCQLAVSLNYCNNPQYLSLTQMFCPVSCNLCLTFIPFTTVSISSKPGVCMDTAAYASLCQLAILVGYCTNPQYMPLTQIYCPVTCNFCTSTG